MNARIFGLVAALLLCASAQAQFISSVVTDSNGLMWANAVGVDLHYQPNGEAGSAQGWVAGLNAEGYGGYNDWTLATGDGSAAPNTTTNQLGELFYTDCGNSPGSNTVLNNPGKNCAALSAIQQGVLDPIDFGKSMNLLLILSDTPYHPLDDTTATGQIFDYGYWTYSVVDSDQRTFNGDTSYYGLVGRGDALAVREVMRAPEIDPTSSGAGLTLLLGTLIVASSRRRDFKKAF